MLKAIPCPRPSFAFQRPGYVNRVSTSDSMLIRCHKSTLHPSVFFSPLTDCKTLSERLVSGSGLLLSAVAAESCTGRIDATSIPCARCPRRHRRECLRRAAASLQGLAAESRSNTSRAVCGGLDACAGAHILHDFQPRERWGAGWSVEVGSAPPQVCHRKCSALNCLQVQPPSSCSAVENAV